MVEWIIVGLLAGLLFVLVNIGKELYHFRDGVHMRDISIKEKKLLLHNIETILIKVEAINTDVSDIERRGCR